MTSAKTTEKIGCAVTEALERRKRITRLKSKVLNNNEPDTSVEASVEDESKENDNTNIIETVPSETNSRVIQVDELDLTKIAPRKVNWDIKRGIAKKLEILQGRTSEVIAEIVRDKEQEAIQEYHLQSPRIKEV